MIHQYQNREDLSTAEGKRRFTTASLQLIGGLQDPVEREHYMEILGSIAGVSLSAIEQKLTSTKVDKKPKRPTRIEKKPPTPVTTEQEETLIALALVAPQTRNLLSSVTADMLQQEENRALLPYLQQNSPISADDLPKDLQKYEQYVKIVQLKSDVRYANWEDTEYQAEMAHTVKQLLIKHRETKKQQLIDQLRAAEADGDDALAESLRRDINALIKEKM